MKTSRVEVLDFAWLVLYISTNPFYSTENDKSRVLQNLLSGEIEYQYDYDIFGNPILTIETYSNAIRYAGEFYDEETGLYYLRARYYNAYTGRFISEDSYWGEDTNPLSLNLYTYAHNDPIRYIDPSGHASEIPDWLDWNRDGVLDSREDKSAFDKDGDSIADWNQGDSNWTYDEEYGWSYKKARSDIPEWLDWDRDGKVDTDEDMIHFDQDNNDVADWLEKDTDQDWVYTEENGWDHKSILSKGFHGPTAEEIRSIYDLYSPNYEENEMYTARGIPNSSVFDDLVYYLLNPDSLSSGGVKASAYTRGTGNAGDMADSFNSKWSENAKKFAEEYVSQLEGVYAFMHLKKRILPMDYTGLLA
ncbi:RHS repeat-associated core domain-containing protein [Marinicrinis sediminis]|uniref:RHS repeat-associated core domain-containing protein n=1 Tax=Marinicrinis sediminis TaxID=1652465 RepID=A0ABW5R6F4_9BACL